MSPDGDLRSANSISLPLKCHFFRAVGSLRSQGQATRLRDDEVHPKKTSDFFFFPLIFQLPSSEKASDQQEGLQDLRRPACIRLCVFLFVGRKWSVEPNLLKTGGGGRSLR